MKKRYTFIIVLVGILSTSMNAQIAVGYHDFETGYTNNTEISTTDPSWIAYGDGFTFPAENVVGSGAESSDWYARMERGGTANYAAVERNYSLDIGETYEFKAWVLPDVSAQKNAYSLFVVDGVTVEATSASPVSGTAWEELSVTYVAAATKSYKFRLRKNWGAAGAKFDNFSVTCTSCTLSVENENAFEFGMYPNPVANDLTISTEEELSSVSIIDLIGQEVKSVQGAINGSIDVSNLASGMYVVRLTAVNGGVSVKKFIKN